MVEPNEEALCADDAQHPRQSLPIRRRFAMALALGAMMFPALPAIALSDNDPSVTGDDPDHPIPYMSKLDLLAQRKTGGADLVIVIATPLKGDERSLRRLLHKIDTYLGFIGSPDYRRQFGTPSPASTRIVVTIDERSDPIVFDLLKRCEAWTLANHAALVVERRPPLK